MKGRILVIDDDDAILQTCRTILDDEGYEVETASNGRTGLDLLSRNSFDLALVDLKMPSMSGMSSTPEAVAEAPFTTCR